MARIDDLIAQVDDQWLQDELGLALSEIRKRQQFGLVFEEHIPETTVLSTLAPQVGSTVQIRRPAGTGYSKTYRVVALGNGTARLRPTTNGDEIEADFSDLLVVKRFGEPIYPTLTPLGSEKHGGDKAEHLVINAENYHALQLLLYLYEGSVDCIYIDPPYNTGARDWKYNNRYVDGNDAWRHSKWLSMMDRRLVLARSLLKRDSVLIVTIDENELHHLGMLLESRFPNARCQVVTICINPGGASSEGLSRVEEYAIFCFLGDAEPASTEDDMLVAGADQDVVHTGAQGVRWEWLLRGGNAWYRSSRPNLCYPILLNEEGTQIIRAGPPLEGDPNELPTEIDGHPAAWPIRRDGQLGIWRVDGARLNYLASEGYAFVSKHDEERGTWTIKYLMSGTVDAIAAGTIAVVGRGDRGQVEVQVNERRGKIAKTVWYRGRHIAGGAGGTHLLNALLGERNLFPFPKSIYAVKDCLEIAVGDKPNALVVDFFAGSGTTMHATALLNVEDHGRRRSIVVTNNEVNPQTTRRLNEEGHYRGDPEFERYGIFEAVTRPRTSAAVTGRQPDGGTVEGTYLNGRAMRDGFEENVGFYRLDYLDRDEIDLGRQFDAIHPLLWMRAGAVGPKPEPLEKDAWYVLPDGCHYAVLLRESRFGEFLELLAKRTDVGHVWLVTDSEDAFTEMSVDIVGEVEVGMLYRQYLRNFRINVERMS